MISPSQCIFSRHLQTLVWSTASLPVKWLYSEMLLEPMTTRFCKPHISELNRAHDLSKVMCSHSLKQPLLSPRWRAQVKGYRIYTSLSSLRLSLRLHFCSFKRFAPFECVSAVDQKSWRISLTPPTMCSITTPSKIVICISPLLLLTAPECFEDA